MDLLRKLRDTLKRAKLSEEEITFYECVLKKPGETVFELAKRAGFSKDKGYAVFESLEAKKLLTVKNENSRRRVFPSSLREFSEKLYSQSRQFWRVGEALENLNPALPLLRDMGAPAQIETFSADEFPEHWLDLSYTPFEYVVSYGNFDMMVEDVGKDPDSQFIRRRVKRGKKASVILTPGPYAEEMVSKDGNQLRNTNVLDVPELKNVLAVIFPDMQGVSLWRRNEKGILSGLMIKNPLIASFHEDLYTYFRKEAAQAR